MKYIGGTPQGYGHQQVRQAPNIVVDGAPGLDTRTYGQGVGRQPFNRYGGHDRAQGGANRLLTVQAYHGRERSLSPASKRAREEDLGHSDGQIQGGPGQGYQQVQPRRRKTNFGKSKVTLEGVEAAPIDIFVGNTNPRATEEKIKEVLILSAAQMPNNPELIINEVKCLNNLDIEPNPRTKCWRISVPYAFKDLVYDDNLYPAGWSHRPFYPAKNKKQQPGEAVRGRQEHM